MKHYNRELADQIETFTVTAAWTLLKMYVTFMLVVGIGLFVIGFVGALIINFVIPSLAHAEDYTPLAPYHYVCLGVNMTCAPVPDRLPYTLKNVEKIKKVLDKFTSDPALMTVGKGNQDSDYLLSIALHDDAGVPYPDLVWAQDDEDVTVGTLIIRTTQGDWCACLNQDGDLYGPLTSDYFTGQTVYYQQDPEF